MSPADWTLLTLLVLILLVLVALTFSRTWRASQARSFSRRVGLALPAELAPTIGIRIARRTRAAAIGAAGGGALGVLLLNLLAETESTARIWLLLGAYFAGLGVGVAVAAITERPVAVDGPRVARSDAVGLADYVSPFERNGARLVVALSVAALIGLLLLPSSGAASSGSTPTPLKIAIVALGIVSLIVFELGSRRIIARSRPAGTPTELAWDDALRAATARDLVTAPLCLGLWGTLFIVFDALASVPAVGDLLIVAGLMIVTLAVVAAIVGAGQKPQRYFLRRLWPELAAAAR